MEISKDIVYVGVNDKNIDLFEGLYEVPNGVSYNSYVILDEKIAIMDTVDVNFTEEWLENIKNVLQGRSPDYLIVQHMEPDHSASIEDFMKKYSNTIIVSSAKKYEIIVIIVPATRFPKTIEVIVSFFVNPIKSAIQVPVQTPVRGNGIATNAKTPSHFIHHTFLSFFSTLAFSLMFLEERLSLFSMALANFFKAFVFFNHLKIGQNRKVNITHTKVLPKNENRKDFHKGSAFSPHNETAAPKGIAPLSSTIGIIDIIVVASQLLSPKIATNKFFNHSVITTHLNYNLIKIIYNF